MSRIKSGWPNRRFSYLVLETLTTLNRHDSYCGVVCNAALHNFFNAYFYWNADERDQVLFGKEAREDKNLNGVFVGCTGGKYSTFKTSEIVSKDLIEVSRIFGENQVLSAYLAGIFHNKKLMGCPDPSRFINALYRPYKA